MLEMRLEGHLVCLCCAVRLLILPSLRWCLVVGSGLGHLTSKEREQRPMVAEVLPELGEATLLMNLHSGRWLAELKFRRRLVSNQCGSLELQLVESICLFAEGGLRHLKPTHHWQVVHGTPHVQCHLVLVHVTLQLEHRRPDALLST